MLQLSSSLEKNLAALNARFGASADFYAKRIELYHCPGAIVLFDNMASLESLWSLLLDAATRHTPSLEPERMPHSGTQVYELLMHHSGLPAEDGPVKDMDDLIRRMTAGMAVLLLDGCKKGLVFSVQGLKSRSVEEPSGEGNLRGSREGFADLLRVNLSLLRRLIRTDTLVMETAQADCAMKTEYAICYCKDKASKTAVARVRRTLQEAKPEGLLDSSYFVPWLFPARWRLFAPVSYTERPASAAAKLCEGKIIILVNGSPSALVLPSLFCENFDCLDDYATTAVFSSFLRVLKYGSFYLSIFLPGVFVCLAVYLPELIPPQLLFKIAAAEQPGTAAIQKTADSGSVEGYCFKIWQANGNKTWYGKSDASGRVYRTDSGYNQAGTKSYTFSGLLDGEFSFREALSQSSRQDSHPVSWRFVVTDKNGKVTVDKTLEESQLIRDGADFLTPRVTLTGLTGGGKLIMTIHNAPNTAPLEILKTSDDSPGFG